MGKKRVAKKETSQVDEALKTRALGKASKKKIENGFLYVNSSYNNTILSLTDEKGNVAFWASAGSLGFKGTKKGTPFAAAKAAELVADKAKLIGLKNIDIVLKGIGAGRESAIRAFINRAEINVGGIKDVTPIPHGGVKPPKPRRV